MNGHQPSPSATTAALWNLLGLRLWNGPVSWTGKAFARVKNGIPAAVRDPLELMLAGNSVLRSTGWLRSRRELASVNADGEPIPWITYPARRFLEARVRTDFRVFEFGSGLSTLWWAARVAQVAAVEHDPQWQRRVAARLPANATVSLATGDDYVRSAGSGPYDIIVNDGVLRPDCARASVSALSPGGVMLWDNTDEVADRAGHDFMADQGFRRLDFWGFGPLMVREFCTSIFYREGNSLGI